MLTFEEAKLKINQKVKCVLERKIDHFEEGQIVEGTLIKVIYSSEVTKDKESVVSFTAFVDVTDPVDGGIHHITSETIFDIEEKSSNIEEVKKAERIAVLEAELAVLKGAINGLVYK